MDLLFNLLRCWWILLISISLTSFSFRVVRSWAMKQRHLRYMMLWGYTSFINHSLYIVDYTRFQLPIVTESCLIYLAAVYIVKNFYHSSHISQECFFTMQTTLAWKDCTKQPLKMQPWSNWVVLWLWITHPGAHMFRKKMLWNEKSSTLTEDKNRILVICFGNVRACFTLILFFYFTIRYYKCQEHVYPKLNLLTTLDSWTVQSQLL